MPEYVFIIGILFMLFILFIMKLSVNSDEIKYYKEIINLNKEIIKHYEESLKEIKDINKKSCDKLMQFNKKLLEERLYDGKQSDETKN